MKRLDKIIISPLKPIFRENGFKKKGHRWLRYRDDFIDIVSVQESKHSSPLTPTFTINLGIGVLEFLDIIWEQNKLKTITEADCVVQLRLGDLIQNQIYGDAIDEWWTLPVPLTESNFLAQQICSYIETLALPFFNQFVDYASLCTHLERTKGWQRCTPLFFLFQALSEWRHGSSSQAIAILDGMEDLGAWNQHRDRVKSMIMSTA